MILLDTHVLEWALLDDPRLGKKTKKFLDDSFQNEPVAVSSITFWEVALLQQKGRLRISSSVEDYRKKVGNLGIFEIPLDSEILIHSVKLQEPHKDPADRMIVATAICKSATLITADEKIIDWKGKLSIKDARK